MAPEIKVKEESLTGDAVIPFGKYKGQKLSDVAKINPGYVRWLANENDDGYKPWGNDSHGAMLQKAAREFTSPEIAQEKSTEQSRASRYRELIEFMRERIQSTKEWEQTQNFYDDDRGGFSDFLQQLTNQLAKGQIPRGKAAEIVIDTYAKWFGGKTRRGTKEYERKRNEFFGKFIKGDEQMWGY